MAKNGSDQSRVHPVILSGGSGTRLWPMSRAAYPKQLLQLTAEQSLLQETALRVADKAMFAPPLLVCNDEHRFIVAEQLREVRIAPRHIVLEPVGRNTAPAVAAAALMLAEDDPSALMLVMPSDHTVADTKGFVEAVAVAASAAGSGSLVTFGIKPGGPETGYGYIRRGEALKGNRCFKVAEFVEKPDLDTAKSYVDDGGHYWNSGMFLFSAKAYLEELSRLDGEMLDGCRDAVRGAERDLDFIRLAKAPFSGISGNSIDYAVMEHTPKAVVVPVNVGWNDVGSWSSLWDIGQKDGDGNVAHGDVLALDSHNSYLRSEGPLIAALGVDDLVVVATSDAVLIVPKERAQDVKDIVDALKAQDRQEPFFHPRVYRPWGFYQTVHDGDRFQVKRISVNVGAQLSLQMHHHRAEHWIVVNGTAKVTRGQETFILQENESTYISPMQVHRLENPGKMPLNLIEVQSGPYLGEDDIVRIEDTYGRN